MLSPLSEYWGDMSPSSPPQSPPLRSYIYCHSMKYIDKALDVVAYLCIMFMVYLTASVTLRYAVIHWICSVEGLHCSPLKVLDFVLNTSRTLQSGAQGGHAPQSSIEWIF